MTEYHVCMADMNRNASDASGRTAMRTARTHNARTTRTHSARKVTPTMATPQRESSFPDVTEETLREQAERVAANSAAFDVMLDRIDVETRKHLTNGATGNVDPRDHGLAIAALNKRANWPRSQKGKHYPTKHFGAWFVLDPNPQVMPTAASPTKLMTYDLWIERVGPAFASAANALGIADKLAIRAPLNPETDTYKKRLAASKDSKTPPKCVGTIAAM